MSGLKETKPRRVTAQEVAQAAGVSRAAVSRAFTPGAYLSEDKKSRILEAAQKLGYRPNALAAGLQRKGRSNLVAVVTGDIANQFDSEIRAKLNRGLNRIGKWSIVLEGPEDMSEEKILEVLAYPLDALILRGGSVSESVAFHCSQLNIPLIVSGRLMPGVDSVCCDNRQGARIAVDQLVASGRRNLAYVGGLNRLYSARERRQGFETALAAHGLAAVAFAKSDYSYAQGYEATTKLLAENPHVDGVFCSNDVVAMGALAAAQQEHGRQVPEDLSIVGFDDISMASWPDFQLSTIKNDMDATVEHILRLLVERLNDEDKVGETVVIKPEFVPRQTH